MRVAWKTAGHYKYFCDKKTTKWNRKGRGKPLSLSLSCYTVRDKNFKYRTVRTCVAAKCLVTHIFFPSSFHYAYLYCTKGQNRSKLHKKKEKRKTKMKIHALLTSDFDHKHTYLYVSMRLTNVHSCHSVLTDCITFFLYAEWDDVSHTVCLYEFQIRFRHFHTIYYSTV